MRLSFRHTAFLAVACACWLCALESTGLSTMGPAAEKWGVCERQAVKVVGRQPVRVGKAVKAPRKTRHVSPRYPPWPSGARASGMWVGEALIDAEGRVRRVWTVREVEIVPPLPAFNRAIVDAIRQWEFDPLVVDGIKVPVCMTVTVNINLA